MDIIIDLLKGIFNIAFSPKIIGLIIILIVVIIIYKIFINKENMENINKNRQIWWVWPF